MTNRRLYGRTVRALAYLPALALIGCVSTRASRADDIPGSARNESRSQLAAGDQVILLRLDDGMREEARAKTSAQGKFTFHVRHPGKTYLVRVIHEGVAYEQEALAGHLVSIPVYDAARQVAGVTGNIEIFRTETEGNLLHVSDMYEISNHSSPPRTVTSQRTFEVYMPANAQIRFVWAAGPDNVRVIISVLPFLGEPGHYAVSFPLRPGATKFGFQYDLAYRGNVAFQTRRVYPVQQFAVMIPPTMRFSSRARGFSLLNAGNPHFQVRAANYLMAGEGPDFEISGSGQLPPFLSALKSQPVPSLPSLPDAAPPVAPQAARPSTLVLRPAPAQILPPSHAAVADGLILILLVTCVVLAWLARRKGNFQAGAHRSR
jgi:hypothetical protein